MKLTKKPTAIKNDICIKGERTTCGSKMLDNFVPPYNATVADKLTAAGFTLNPGRQMDENSSADYDLALCSDHNGLARRLATANKLIALKPTYGSVSRYGLITPAPSLDQITPIGKTVRDVAELYNIICGADEKDSTTIERDYPDFTADDEAIAHLYKIGAVVGTRCAAFLSPIKINLPSAEHALTAFQIIACAEGFSNLARYDGIKFGYRSDNAATLAELYENTRAEGFGEWTKKSIILGAIALSKQYRHQYYDRAIRARAQITAELNTAFEQCDIIIAPLDETWSVIPNLTGCPSITIGGIQLIGPKFSEEMLFRVATEVEKNA